MVDNCGTLLRLILCILALSYSALDRCLCIILSNEPAVTYCRLPPKPEGTNYSIGGCMPNDTNYFFCRSEPGRIVQQFMQVIYYCEEHYKLPDNLENSTSAFCINGKWQPREIVCEYDENSFATTTTDVEYIDLWSSTPATDI